MDNDEIEKKVDELDDWWRSLSFKNKVWCYEFWKEEHLN